MENQGQAFLTDNQIEVAINLAHKHAEMFIEQGSLLKIIDDQLEELEQIKMLIDGDEPKVLFHELYCSTKSDFLNSENLKMQHEIIERNERSNLIQMCIVVVIGSAICLRIMGHI
jgi:predicted SprT family Zn-dependent metalloprotease